MKPDTGVFFWKSVEKTEVSHKSDKNNRYFVWRYMYIYDNISPNSSQNEKYFTKKLQRKAKHMLHVQELFILNHAIFMR